MPVIPVTKVVDKKRIIIEKGGPRRGKGTRGLTPPPKKILFNSVKKLGGYVPG
jgi:hypothetical protein